ncbi:type VII secretion target [Kibdelosporangium aridum]|uniref:Excreted virulence factor EspC, type VII ESX diderm n=1 Tax=Kibdelosporangium aridum TaxID=2030 RepID=A0A1Y5XJ67_KIBAR|nr:type VII secretion target [Kibdelosporangium aridum]SMC98200.1 Excreted virulence factor EspC, type VII ESX diderm [Kibdelosporangium aridum]
MGQGLEVDTEELLAHARKIEAIRDRFDAVKSASAHIAQDDQAYGLLCGWISGVLEGRHTRQDELLDQVKENLDLVAKSLRHSANEYQAVDRANAGLMEEVADGGLL